MGKRAVFFVSLAAVVWLGACSVGSDNSLVGDWVAARAYGPYTDVWQFDSNGTYMSFFDYRCTNPQDGGTWSISGSTLTMDSNSLSIEWLDNDSYRLSMPGKQIVYYRKGHEPEGSIFGQVATALTTTYQNYNLQSGQSKLFTFTVGGPATVEFEEAPTSSYTADVDVSTVASDKTTVIADQEPDSPAANVAAGTYYVIVDCLGTQHEGSFAIRYQ